MGDSEFLYSKTASGNVLGALLNDTQLVYNPLYPLDKEDFRPFQIQYIIFVCIYNLAKNDCKSLDAKDIGEYLEKFPPQKKVMEEEIDDWVGYINTLKALDNGKNTYDYYYQEVRKRSLLRDYYNSGFNISKFYDIDKSKESQDKELEKYSIDDILKHFDTIQDEARQKYQTKDDETTRKKAGENGNEILVSFKNHPRMGLSFESKYLTTLWGGLRKRQLYLRSGDTSSGKSRSIVGDLACACCKEIYDIDRHEWYLNPNGKHKGLYIGCEMELNEEVDPLFWSYISGVDSSLITDGEYTDEEAKLIEKAIDIVNDDCMWLIDMPNFNVTKLENEIRTYKEKYDIDYVGFDYMLLNNALVKEYCEERGRGVGVRGDEILGDLSKDLKDMAKKYDIGLITGTQVNSMISDFKMRNYQVLRGSKAVADKATGGSISMPITSQELKLVQPICEKLKHKMGFNYIEPNFVETVYKSRFSKYPKECKIFSYFNLGNMRKKELFVTDKDFNPINVPMTIVKGDTYEN